MRELCLGSRADPSLSQSAELLRPAESARRPPPAAWLQAPPGKPLLLEHSPCKSLLDAEPGRAGARVPGHPLHPALAARVRVLATEWEWLCGPLTGEVTTSWPSLQTTGGARMTGLARRLGEAPGSGRCRRGPGPGPGCSAPCSGSAGCSRRIPCRGANSARSGRRSLGNGSPCWRICWDSGGRSSRSGGGGCWIPATAAGGAALGLSLAQSLRPWPATAKQDPQVTSVASGIFSHHLLEAEPRHIGIAFCREERSLSALAGAGAVRAPLHTLRASPG